jgi:error-prone DNA polymerase
LEQSPPSLAGIPPSPGTPGEGRREGLRLGLRLIKGLSASHAARIPDCRRETGLFRSIDHFHEITGLPVHVITRLSAADAFASLPKTRRHALWETLALPDQRPPLPLTSNPSPLPALTAQTLGQEIHADYGTAGLSLKGHPMQVLRDEMARLRVIPAAEVWNRPHGGFVRVAGIVLIRQRPGTAKGIVFETIEDETGIVNLIIRPDVYEQWHSAARHASLLQADGTVERHGQVQHVMAVRLYDLTHVLAGHATRSRDFH